MCSKIYNRVEGSWWSDLIDFPADVGNPSFKFDLVCIGSGWLGHSILLVRSWAARSLDGYAANHSVLKGTVWCCWASFYSTELSLYLYWTILIDNCGLRVKSGRYDGHHLFRPRPDAIQAAQALSCLAMGPPCINRVHIMVIPRV